MFKNKGFLYGLGLGLILGASLLQLMNFAVLDNKTISNDIPTISPTQSSSPKSSIAPIKTITPTETTVNPDTPSSTAASTPAVAKAVEPSAPTIADPAISIVIIEKGMTSSEVAALLFDKGVISDRKSFDDSLSHLKLDRVIRAGSYNFLPNEKDSDIIDKITIRR